MDPLAKLFSSSARAKLLRLFIYNQNESFTFEQVSTRAKVSPREARGELLHLQGADVIRRGGSPKNYSYRTNPHYEHLAALDAFVRTTTMIRPADLLKTLKKVGNLQCVLLSGFFTGAMESQLDLLIVGDRIDERSLARVIASLEADLGREIRYASFPTEDFRYRMGVYDRLLRDIFDYPNRPLLDKIGL